MRRKSAKKIGEIFSLVQAVLLGRPNLSLENRRSQQRLRLKVPVLVKHGDEEVRAELRDLSQTGMRLVLPARVDEDDTVRVSALSDTGLVGRQRLVCRVAWVKSRKPDFEVGLEYNDTDENVAHSWIQLALRHLDPDQVKRRARRIPANLWCQINEPNGDTIGKGVCVNLSTGGCLLQLERQLGLGDVIRLGLGPGDQEPSIFLSGKVLRYEPSKIHGTFLHHVQFFPGENRNHQRLRSLMLTLLEELEDPSDLDEDPEIDWEAEQAQTPSLFTRLSAPVALHPGPAPRPREVEEPRIIAPTELDFRPRPVPGQEHIPMVELPPEPPPLPVRADKPPPLPARLSEREKPDPLAEPYNNDSLADLIGRQPAAQLLRPFTNRSNSLWAARNLPVSSRKNQQPDDQRRLPTEPPRPDQDHGDYRDSDFR